MATNYLYYLRSLSGVCLDTTRAANIHAARRAFAAAGWGGMGFRIVRDSDGYDAPEVLQPRCL